MSTLQFIRGESEMKDKQKSQKQTTKFQKSVKHDVLRVRTAIKAGA